MESGETPGKALIRELAEELGVAVETSAIRPFSFVESEGDDGSAGLVILLYTVLNWQGKAKALEPGAELAWVTLQRMTHIPMPPLDVILSRGLIATFGENTGS